MPKLKTLKAAAKRFKATASGLFKHKQSHKRHLLTHKSSKRKRGLRGMTLVHHEDSASVRRCLPLLSKKGS